jgi:uncharacterized protein DUF3592
MKSSPFIGLVAIFLLVFGIWQSMRLATLGTAGIRTEGRIVGFQPTWSSSASGGQSTHYDPIVKFRSQDNREIEFKDSIGRYLPMYLFGPHVTVLYSAADPRGSAMIDRGPVLNWAIPALTLLAGVFATGLTLLRMHGGSNEATTEPAELDRLAVPSR